MKAYIFFRHHQFNEEKEIEKIYFKENIWHLVLNVNQCELYSNAEIEKILLEK